MAPRKTYGQFCALARALDHVGDRWSLLVVRELLLGPATFRELRRSLGAVGPTLLVDRLRRLEADGLVERNDAPARSKAVAYALTPAGTALEPAVFELIRWGARWMADGPGADQVDPRWAVLALRALLDGAVGARDRGTVHVDVGGTDLAVQLAKGTRRVRPHRPDAPGAVVRGTMPEVLALASGLRSFDESSVVVEGDREMAAAALAPGPRPGDA